MLQATTMLATTATLHGWLYDTFAPADWVRAVLYGLTWLVMLGGVTFLFVWAPRRNRANHWTTQDVFVLAILSVLLLSWDTFLNDQLFGPIVSSLPLAGTLLNWIQLPDLPYMFIVMVGVATIRKPGTVTALIFVKRVLGEVMFSTHGVNVLIWPDALDEGIFTDLYIMSRGEMLLSDVRSMLIDGFVIGVLRAVPNTIIGDAVLDPFLNGQVHTWASFIGTNLAGGGGILGNGLGNGLEAAITAPLAVRVARSTGILSGYRPTPSPTLHAPIAARTPGARAPISNAPGRWSVNNWKTVRLFTIIAAFLAGFLLVDGLALFATGGLSADAGPVFPWLGGTFTKNHSSGTGILIIGALAVAVLVIGWFTYGRRVRAQYLASQAGSTGKGNGEGGGSLERGISGSQQRGR